VKLVEDLQMSFKSPIAVEGLPDIGLVGTIAASHIIEQLNLKQVAHLESDEFPPVMVLHGGVIKNPVSIYGNDKLIVLTSEIPIPVITIYDTARVITRWFKDKGITLEVSLSGFPIQDRVNIIEPKVYAVANNKESKDILNKKEIEVMEEGFLSGAYALILKELIKYDLPAIALLSQSFLKYPDPAAAAAVILALNKIAGMDIGVKNLLEKGDEIRIKARDLMRQSEGTIGDMLKPVEQTIPIMYR